MREHRSRNLFTSTVLASALLVVGCSSSGSRAATQPTPNASTFTSGVFDNIRRYPGSTPIGPERHTEGVTVRSFVVSSDVPRQVVTWFGDNLDGWTVVQAPRAYGTKAYRGVWEKNDRRLLVSSAPAPTVEHQSAQLRAKTQYTLTLGDAGVAVTGPNAGSGSASASTLRLGAPVRRTVHRSTDRPHRDRARDGHDGMLVGREPGRDTVDPRGDADAEGVRPPFPGTRAARRPVPRSTSTAPPCRRSVCSGTQARRSSPGTRPISARRTRSCTHRGVPAGARTRASGGREAAGSS